jgi:hypothetical protein
MRPAEMDRVFGFALNGETTPNPDVDATEGSPGPKAGA